MNIGPMLNAYPDSMGGTLDDIAAFLQKPEMKVAASSADRLGTTVQLSNVGIAPGSGVGNHRREISARVLGVPVVALGIPTVVSSRVLGGTAEEMYVTPREIDQLINRGAKLLGMSINVCLQRHLQPRDLYTLVG